MSFFMLILGIILILGGVCCVFTPLATLAAAGYFIAAVLIVSGAAGIIAGIRYRVFSLNFVACILALALGVLAIVRPGGIEVIDRILIILFAIWLLFRGYSSIALSLKLKKLRVSSAWIWGFIIGVLAIALGIFSFVQPIVPAVTIGMLIGFYFIEEGIGVITTSRVARAMEKGAAPLKR
ncbi:MAG: DUF308 domain-containing protein [Firmicutes bacterium]|nr:DUF308 domain-containing protein [Bacillota bacterium]